MKFDYCVGNPPYQEQRGSGSVPIWQNFINESVNIANIACMIHPGRWIQPDGTLYKKNT